MRSALWASLVVPLALLASGCRLARMEGLGSRSVATSRQFSQEGVTAMERDQWDRAELLLSQAVRACPSDPDARRNYADALWHRGARQEAVAQLAEAIRRAPENAASHARLAEMRLAMGNVEAALASAERSADLDPKLGSAWAVRARIMRAKRQPQEALANYHRALGCCPADSEIPLEIAEVYLQTAQPERSLAALQRLAEHYAPGDEPQGVLYLEGLSCLALHRYGDALTSLQAAAKREPATPEILVRMAEAQMALGDPAAAGATVREALALDPKHEPSRELLDRVEVTGRPGAVLQR